MKSLETICLSNLISFSQDEWVCEQIYELNGFDRLINLLKSLNPEGTTNNLIIELSLLLISNLTQTKEGVFKLLHYGEKEHLAVHFIYIFEKFMSPKTSESYKFAGNVFANITAIKEARELLISPEYQLLPNLINLANSHIKEIRLGCVKTIRNLTFEYENQYFLDQIFNEKNDFVDTMVILLAKIIIYGDTDEKTKNEIKSSGFIHNEGVAWKEVKFMEEVINVLDIILVLTNINEVEKKVKYNRDDLAKISSVLKPLVPGDIKDKIDVILCILCQLNPQNI